MQPIAIGIDLAWSPKNRTGLAVATIDTSEVKVLETSTARTTAEILDFVARYVSAPLTIAIDAPTIVPNLTGMRPVERDLQRDRSLQRAYGTPYPANRELLGKWNNGVPRGEEIVNALGHEFQVQEAGLPPPLHTDRYAMEVFPLAAMVRLFDLTSPLPYKNKKGRTADQCRSGLTAILGCIQKLGNPALILPPQLKVSDERAGRLKDVEDRMDASICAYIAALAWLGKAECLGTLRDGYIVMPIARDPMKASGTPLYSPLSSRFSDALVFAADIHRSQRRKGTQIPYIAHILGVVAIALECDADEDEAIAAALHDSIEDAPTTLGSDKGNAMRRWIEFKFGTRVLEIVEGCTDADTEPKPPWRERKEQYVARIAHEPASVLLVSAADKLHNARAVLRDFRTDGMAVFGRFNKEAGAEGTIGYYRGLLSAFRSRAPQVGDPRLARLIAEFDETVAALERETGIVGRWPIESEQV